MELQRIIEALPSLNQAELDKLRVAISFLVSKKDALPLEKVMYHALHDTCTMDGEWQPGYEHFRGSGAYPQFKRHLPGFSGLLARLAPDAGRMAYAVARMLYGLLADDLRAKSVPVTVGIMVTNMGRVQAVFDQAYPGYLESGLGHLVPQAMRRRHGEGSKTR